MCGWAPALAALVAALEQGASRAELVAYATSADAGGGTDRVVGYAGVAIA
jgi:AmmeMemoRadiSam system protein B